MRPMRSKFSQTRRSVPSLNVASMPDLIAEWKTKSE